MAISKVVVVDGNNLIVQIDRGVAGRGITDVQPVEINNSLYLEFFFTDGTTETVGPVGTIQYIGQSPIVVNASTISLSTVPVNLGGTGQTTANAGFNALAPSQTSNSGKYLKTDGTNTSWDLLDISTGDITGTLPVTNGGTGATTASGARTNLAAAASATTISAGTGLSGGGDLTANRTLSIANTGVTAAAYGSASKTLTATVNAQGQLTVLADTNIAITNTQVSGLGTASTLNAGVALGVATLDAGGTVPLSQIPASIQGGVSYQGTWNATTNTPTLTSSVGSKGYYYVVSVAGSTNLNGITSWNIGDWAIFNGTAWEKIDNTDAVTSVNGYTGTVVLTNTDITGFGTMSTQNANNVSITGGSVTGITDLAIADGGTGQSTAAAAITALTGTQVAGRYLRSDGTNAALSAIQAADVPTLNQNTSGTAAGLSATLAISSGGTGQTTANTAFNALAPSQTGNSGKYLTTDGSNTSWATNPLGTVTSVGVSGGTTGLTTSGGPITTSGTITLAGTLATTNGGTGLTSFTANGVVYASSTSALATGSALTFNGTTTLTLSSGSQGYLIGPSSEMLIGADNSGLYVGNGAGGTPAIPIFFGSTGTTFQRWNAGGSEQMRLTSTGLGIGTSSPNGTLTINKPNTTNGTVFLNGATSTPDFMRIKNTGGDVVWGVESSTGGSIATGSSAYAGVLYTVGSTSLQFGTSGSIKATLDSAGNLGIGTSSPSGIGKALNVYGGSGDVSTVIAEGDAGAKFLALYSGSASNDNGAIYSNQSIRFGYATSKAAAGYTNLMTLDTSGNLGLGVTPSAWSQGKAFEIGAVGYGLWYGSGSPSSTYLLNNAYYNSGFKYGGTGQAAHYYQYQGAHVWSTAPSGTAGNAISFSQVMTLDASGNLLVGTTSAINGVISVVCPDDTRNCISAQVKTNGNNAVGFRNAGGTQVGSITVNSTTTTYNVTSDYRLKDIAGPVANSGAFIDKLNPVQGSWKADGSRFIGFLAHELQEASETVVGTGIKDGEEMQSIDYSNAELIANLVAELKSLRTRLAALEAK
jgi:hypothetical protein